MRWIQQHKYLLPITLLRHNERGNLKGNDIQRVFGDIWGTSAVWNVNELVCRKLMFKTNTRMDIDRDEVISNFSATFYLMTSQFSQPSMSAPSTIGRTRSIRRYDPLHPVLPTAREICRSCFENPHNDFGNRVLSRVYEKRQDFQKFVNTVGKEKW